MLSASVSSRAQRVALHEAVPPITGIVAARPGMEARWERVQEVRANRVRQREGS